MTHESSLQETWSGDLLLLQAVIPVRPTGHRLLIAMGAASILLAALLQLDMDLEIGVASYSARKDVPLILGITQPKVEQTSESNRADQAIHKSIAHEQVLNDSEIGRSERGETFDDSADPRVGPDPVRQWYALMEKSAEATVAEYFRRDDLRASMWRETRSIMFQPGNDFSVIEEEPILANIKFRQPVGVLGIGITVGSCFIGIPILGVPVEERTVGIRLFVCRDVSG